MTHDTGLVEAVKARILKAKADDVILEEHDANTLARAALDAINASGTHVVVSTDRTIGRREDAIRAAAEAQRQKDAEIARNYGEKLLDYGRTPPAADTALSIADAIEKESK